MCKRMKDYVNFLSAKNLWVAADFLAYLADNDEIDSIEELLSIS